jgi:signal transduction histidine kinase
VSRPNEPHGTRSSAPRSSPDLLRTQREANESLVIATLRADEAKDRAREAQRSAEDATSALRATAEFRERLIGIIGHDLRGPLNVMLMGCGLLMGGGHFDEGEARVLHRMADSGQRMMRMISQLLDFTRARLGGGFVLTRVRADLGDICRNIAGELRIGASADVRASSEGDLVGVWDVDRLSEIISNIAGNAVDHAAPGTSVFIRAHDRGPDEVLVDVTNEGPPIPPDILPVLFEPFRRAEQGVASRGEHLGLGLYIARALVEAHGGSIAARSADGTTTFTIRVPRAARRPEPPRAGSASAAAPAA